MSGALSRGLRSAVLGGLTRLPPARFEGSRGVVVAKAAQRVLAGGEITIAGGAAGGLRLSSDSVSLGHPHAYGLLRGVLEPSVQEALRRTVFPGATVYDIGADVGFFTILAARLTGPSGRVEAFEPVAESADTVEANAGLNDLGHVHVHRVAVGETPGDQTLHVRDAHSWSHLADRGDHGVIRERLTVSVVCLDTEIANGRLPAPAVIKVDVEGSEVAVLRGMSETLRRYRPTIICELHETNREVMELFNAAEYTLENLDGTAPIEVAGAVHVLARARDAQPHQR